MRIIFSVACTSLEELDAVAGHFAAFGRSGLDVTWSPVGMAKVAALLPGVDLLSTAAPVTVCPDTMGDKGSVVAFAPRARPLLA